MLLVSGSGKTYTMKAIFEQAALDIFAAMGPDDECTMSYAELAGKVLVGHVPLQYCLSLCCLSFYCLPLCCCTEVCTFLVHVAC